MIEIVEPSVELIDEHNCMKKIELCGRVCYKSESKITDNSASRMIRALINNGHHSVLEHFMLAVSFKKSLFDDFKIDYSKMYGHFLFSDRNTVYGNVRAWRNYLKEDPIHLGKFTEKYPELFGDIDQQNRMNFLNDFDLKEYDRYATFRIVTSRGISHELVRHRVFSFSQESTRYCNYGGKSIRFVRPIGFKWADDSTSEQFKVWRNSCSRSAIDYENMIEIGMKPQEARNALNQSAKTELMMTGNFNSWKHFLFLRTDEKTVHPEMLTIARMIEAKLNSIKSFKEMY